MKTITYMLLLLGMTLSSCLYSDEFPEPSMDSLTNNIFEYTAEDRDIWLWHIGTLQVTDNDGRVQFIMQSDSLDFTIEVENMTLLRSGAAWNIPSQTIYNEYLDEEMVISGVATHYIQQTTWYDGYAYMYQNNADLQFQLETSFADGTTHKWWIYAYPRYYY